MTFKKLFISGSRPTTGPAVGVMRCLAPCTVLLCKYVQGRAVSGYIYTKVTRVHKGVSKCI